MRTTVESTAAIPVEEVAMKRRILLVDDDLAVLLTLKAVLELHGFEVETANSSAEAFARLDSGVYQMVISDLRMETEEAGLEVLRRARRQAYDPATALLTAYPPAGGSWRGEHWGGEGHDDEDWDRRELPFATYQTARHHRAVAPGGGAACQPRRPAKRNSATSTPGRKKPGALQDEDPAGLARLSTRWTIQGIIRR